LTDESTGGGLRIELPEGACVLTLIGEHDAFGAGALERELDQQVESGRPIVVDLGEATFIDSSTVGVLLSVYRRVQERGLAFELVLPSTAGPWVHRLIQTTKLDTVFEIYDSVPAALEAAHRHH
jgi:anti-sigma B factor antagonist